MPIDEGTGEPNRGQIGREDYDPPKKGRTNQETNFIEMPSMVPYVLKTGTLVSVSAKFGIESDSVVTYYYSISVKDENGQEKTGDVLVDKIDLIEDEEDAYTETYFNPPLRATVINEFSLLGEVGWHSVKPGTKVSVEYEYLDSKGVKWYGIKLVENGKTYTGKTVATDVELIPVPETPTVKNDKDGITLSVTESEGATYQWQRKVVDADGKESWVDVEDGTDALLSLPLKADALLSEYRCVTTRDNVETPSAAIRPVNDEWVEWLENNDVTTEMIRRALGKKSLESVVVENGKLIYVRDGKAIAEYNPETGYITDITTGLIVAEMDESGNILPIIPAA